MTQFVKADLSKGKKATQVVLMLEQLKEANGDPVPFEEMCSTAGAKYPQDVQAAMFALEQTGFVERYTFTERGSTKSRTAYALTKEALSADPS